MRLSRRQKIIINWLRIHQRPDCEWLHIADIGNSIDQERTRKNSYWLRRSMDALEDRDIVCRAFECGDGSDDSPYYSLTDVGVSILMKNFQDWIR
jgi:hypothetical protein